MGCVGTPHRVCADLLGDFAPLGAVAGFVACECMGDFVEDGVGDCGFVVEFDEVA